MSRVGDSSDEQRIKEMQEAQFRKKVDREKKDVETRQTRSFNEVMGDKTRRQMAKEAAQNQKAAEETETRGRTVLDQVRTAAKKKEAPTELGRRAALARAANQGLARKRSVDAQEGRVAVEERVSDLSAKQGEDVERIDKEVEREEDLDAKRTDEQDTEHRMDNATPDRVDPDGRGQKQQQQQQGQSDEQRGPRGVEQADGPRAAHKVQVPADLIQKIVGKLFQAISADGRTSLQLDLKGEGLEGVTLKVASEDGRVSCTFEGCSAELKTALRKGKPALMRALAKKNLKLVNLRVS